MFKDSHLVLLVEDNLETLGMLTKVFSKSGFFVKSADNVLDAIAQLDEDVDIVVTDLNMKNLTGADLSSMVKSKFHVPVVLITGDRSINTDDILKKCDFVLYKPFPPVKLLKTVTEMLRGHFCSLEQEAA